MLARRCRAGRLSGDLSGDWGASSVGTPPVLFAKPNALFHEAEAAEVILAAWRWDTPFVCVEVLMSRRALLPLGLTFLAACWHATVETGLTRSAVIIERSWASSWIYGLVPPKTVQTASRCPDGVAKVETELTFLNQVVHLLTLGIYTPMRIRVTCAQRNSASAGAGAAALTVPAGSSDLTVRAVFRGAADQTVQQRQAVVVYFEQDQR
jgi:hypothetical protein